jgi:hypothetical protein
MTKEYFIRMRGRITGPFELEVLRSMLRLGTLSRVHDISSDKHNWLAVGSVAELFPSQETDHGAIPLKEDESDQPGADAPGEELFYLSQNGVTTGPFSWPALTSMATRGSINPMDSVWSTKNSQARTASNWPSLMHAATASPPRANTTMPPSPVAAVNEPGADATKQFNKLSLADGICVGVVLFLCTNIPYTRSGGRLIWWWNLWGQFGGGMLLIFSVYALIAGVTLIFVASLTKGLARGWSYLVVAGLGFCLLTIAMITGPRGGGYMASPLLFPAPLVAMMGVLLFRRGAPEATYARAIQVVTASLLCLACVVAGIFIVIGLSDSSPGESVPAWAIVTMVLSVASLVVALACGVCGLVSSGPTCSKGMTVTIVILGISAMSLFLVSGVVFGFGVASIGFEGARFVLVFALRFLVITYSLAVLLAIGLFEIMTHFRHSSKTVEILPGPAKEQTT